MTDHRTERQKVTAARGRRTLVRLEAVADASVSVARRGEVLIEGVKSPMLASAEGADVGLTRPAVRALGRQVHDRRGCVREQLAWRTTRDHSILVVRANEIVDGRPVNVRRTRALLPVCREVAAVPELAPAVCAGAWEMESDVFRRTHVLSARTGALS